MRSSRQCAFTVVDGTYIGHLAPDGQSIVGTWTQNSAAAPLNLTRAVAGAEWVIPTPVLNPRAMDANADPAFEVATIKSSNPDEHRKFFRLSPDRLEGVNETVADMITFSYGVHRKQILNRPGLDRTGLTGRYDFKLSWTPDDAQWSGPVPDGSRPSADANPAPPLYTALQEQPGLKFSAAKALAEVYVIDDIEEPAEN